MPDASAQSQSPDTGGRDNSARRGKAERVTAGELERGQHLVILHVREAAAGQLLVPGDGLRGPGESVNPLGVLKHRHETEIHMHLVMAVKERGAGIVS